MNATAYSETEKLAARLLNVAGLDASAFNLEPMLGGRNNKVYRLVQHDGRAVLLKCYFRHPQDPRDRLGQESAFLRHLENTGCALVPRLLSEDRDAHAALLEYVEGTRISLEEITEHDIDQACEFFRQANATTGTPSARSLPIASEACFSIAEHLKTAQRRVDRLTQIAVVDALDEKASSFAQQELVPLWENVRATIETAWPNEADRPVALPPSERCLSPSDFGFHNALREASGRIRFLDFEYAGWDDPAKLVCDFANQPDMLLPRPLSRRFREAVLAWSANSTTLARRIEALEPLYQVKWACICMNDFLQAGQRRRLFTEGESANHYARREFQLGRARQMLALGRHAASQP